jgi:hypothetical protein
VGVGVGIAASVWGGVLCIFCLSKKRILEYAAALF